MPYAIQKVSDYGPEPWWDGERFVRDRSEARLYASLGEAMSHLDEAGRHSYVPIQVIAIPKDESPGFVDFLKSELPAVLLILLFGAALSEVIARFMGL